MQELGQGRLGDEARIVAEELARRGLPTTFFHAKEIARRRLPLDRGCFVVGDVDCVHGALRQLGVDAPTPDDYPESLRPWLRRRVWRATVRDVLRSVNEGTAVFAKPAEALKRFTGRVFATPADTSALHGVSGRAPVWCAETVAWRSEFRAYVVRGEVVALAHYDGDESAPPDGAVLRAALDALSAAGAAPAGYGIDFGVLATGETALVEKNEGYALGAYGIDGAAYTALLLARWSEILGDAAVGR